MKRKVSILLTVSVFLLLAGCGENAKNDDSAFQTDAPHTFAGYPVVYLTADISAQGLLSAYEALEPAESGPILYIAVLDQWSVGDPAYGGNILASYDPVSLDQACVDLINMTEECQSLAAHIAVCKGIYTLVNAEQMGWGSRTYAFLSID